MNENHNESIKNKKKGLQKFLGGNSFLSKGENELAINQFNKAIELLLDNTDILDAVYWSIGKAKSNLGKFEEAIIDYSKAINLNNDYLIAYVSRGNCYIELQKWELGIRDLKYSLNLEFDTWHKIAIETLYERSKIYSDQLQYDIYYNLGFAYCHLGELQNAISCLQVAKSIFPSSKLNNFMSLIYNRTMKMEEYYKKGSYKLKSGDYREAIKFFNKAVELDSMYINAYICRGNCNTFLHYYNEAIKDFDKAIELDPTNKLIYFNRGYAKLESYDYKEALDDFIKAIEIDPEFKNAYYKKEICEKIINDPQFEIHNKIIQKSKKGPLIFFMKNGTKKAGELNTISSCKFRVDKYGIKTFEDIDLSDNLFNLHGYGVKTGYEILDLSEIESVELLIRYEDMTWK